MNTIEQMIGLIFRWTHIGMMAVAPQPSLMDWCRKIVRDLLGPILRPFHSSIDRWLGGLPMWVAMACAIGLYVAAILWVFTLKREFIFRGAPDNKAWRDLRIWSVLVVLPYIAVYLWLGR